MGRDLRTWLAQAEAIGELVTVRDAHWDIEIGTIVDLYQEKMGRPALLFDHVPGYPQGFRVAANSLASRARVAMTMGLSPDTSMKGIIDAWRKYNRTYHRIAPNWVESGPLLENVETGSDINLLRFPTPRWHEEDGGRFIGTGSLVIMKDPDSDWVNVGTYRVQVQDERTATVMISQGKQGRRIMEKYFQRGLPCPVAISAGHDPLLLFASGLEVPEGVSEFEVAGGLLGEAIDVVRGPFTGLPLPAGAEIVIEGEISPTERLPEGPFGEWTGYYAGGMGKEPVINIHTLLYRNDPIILGNIPAPPPCDDTYYRGFLRAGEVWEQLECAGIPGIQGVWAHEAGGSRQWLTVAIKQLYPGHSKQTGLAACSVAAGAYANKFVVVVDDDVDPSDMDQVIWALCTRVEAVEDVEILRRTWSSALDPTAKNRMNSRMVIDACRPWERLKDFPPIARASMAVQQQIKEKFKGVFPASLGF